MFLTQLRKYVKSLSISCAFFLLFSEISLPKNFLFPIFDLNLGFFDFGTFVLQFLSLFSIIIERAEKNSSFESEFLTCSFPYFEMNPSFKQDVLLTPFQSRFGLEHFSTRSLSNKKYKILAIQRLAKKFQTVVFSKYSSEK